MSELSNFDLSDLSDSDCDFFSMNDEFVEEKLFDFSSDDEDDEDVVEIDFDNPPSSPNPPSLPQHPNDEADNPISSPRDPPPTTSKRKRAEPAPNEETNPYQPQTKKQKLDHVTRNTGNGSNSDLGRNQGSTNINGYSTSVSIANRGSSRRNVGIGDVGEPRDTDKSRGDRNNNWNTDSPESPIRDLSNARSEGTGQANILALQLAENEHYHYLDNETILERHKQEKELGKPKRTRRKGQPMLDWIRREGFTGGIRNDANCGSLKDWCGAKELFAKFEEGGGVCGSWNADGSLSETLEDAKEDAEKLLPKLRGVDSTDYMVKELEYVQNLGLSELRVIVHQKGETKDGASTNGAIKTTRKFCERMSEHLRMTDGDGRHWGNIDYKKELGDFLDRETDFISSNFAGEEGKICKFGDEEFGYMFRFFFGFRDQKNKRDNRVQDERVQRHVEIVDFLVQGIKKRI